MITAAVLCAREDSIYKTLPHLDVFDIYRDAMTFNSDLPVIAHPPCRSWGRLKHFARPRPGERDLARFCVNKIRSNGGVLEHPVYSSLWSDMDMSKDCHIDEYGGWTLPFDQHWFGHLAEKRTWLYIVGCAPVDIPRLPYSIAVPSHVIETNSKTKRPRPAVKKSQREHTPLDLANYLISLTTVIGCHEVSL